MERLQKVISNSGYTSRRKAEELILNNKVLVNNEIVNTLGYKVDDNDIIIVEGNLINKKVNYKYYILNKPREVISSVSDDKNRKTVIDIVKCSERIYPVGRLDYDTTGIILLTNDGYLANMLIHPSHKIYKTYIAKINGILNELDFKNIRNGIMIDQRKLTIDYLKVKNIDKIKNTSLIEVTIHEGRNHIIKRFFEALGYDVLKLSRIKFANLSLNDLKSGEYRELSKEEVKSLYELVK